MHAARIDEIDGHGRSHPDHAHASAFQELHCPEGADETIDSEPPGLAVCNPDSTALLRYAYEGRAHRGMARRGGDGPLDFAAGDAGHQKIVRSRPAEEAPLI